MKTLELPPKKIEAGTHAEWKTSFNGLSQERLFFSKHGILFAGDCFKLFHAIKNNSIDLVFADPPFNLNKNYGPSALDRLTEENYLDWSKRWITEAVRVLKPGGSLFIYNIPKWSIHLGAFLNEQTSMVFHHWIAISMKNTYPRGNYLYPAHYALLYYTKGQPKTVHKLRTPIPACRHCGKDIKDYGGHRNKLHPDGLNLTDFWEDTSPVRHAKFKKRAANELKPIIPCRTIQLSTQPGDIVLDPFGGGGSTYAEAEKLKRLWIGSEIESYDSILQRLSEECRVNFDEKPESSLLKILNP